MLEIQFKNVVKSIIKIELSKSIIPNLDHLCKVYTND